MEVVARGVRNSVGFDFHPRTKELWFTDNGRDWLNDDGPEEELNRVTKVGEFFGFPYCHANGIPDPDVSKANACAGVTMPVTTLGAHAAASGCASTPAACSRPSIATASSSRAAARGTARSSTATTSFA